MGYEPPKDEAMLESIFKMGRLARSEVAQAKQAFLLRDVAVAEDLVRQDERDQPLEPVRVPRARSRSAPTRTGASGRCR